MRQWADKWNKALSKKELQERQREAIKRDEREVARMHHCMKLARSILKEEHKGDLMFTLEVTEVATALYNAGVGGPVMIKKDFENLHKMMDEMTKQRIKEMDEEFKRIDAKYQKNQEKKDDEESGC